MTHAADMRWLAPPRHEILAGTLRILAASIPPAQHPAISSASRCIEGHERECRRGDGRRGRNEECTSAPDALTAENALHVTMVAKPIGAARSANRRRPPAR